MLSFHMEESRSAIIRHPTKRLQGLYVDEDYIYCLKQLGGNHEVGLVFHGENIDKLVKLEFLGRLDLISKKILSP